jgi:proton glutamate symport protein
MITAVMSLPLRALEHRATRAGAISWCRAATQAATAVFLAHLYGVHLGAGQLATIVLATIVASSAGAGVPGSSLVTTLIVLNAIGLGSNASAGIALIAGIDRPLDMCRTAVNTFSNLVGTVVVARAQGER